jgi:hypothetical protein
MKWDKRKLYISGAISGHDINSVIKRFGECERLYTSRGFEVRNPLNNNVPYKASYKEHMIADIKMLLECDSILMMRGWENSKGANLEKHIAEVLNFKIIYEK